MKKKKTTAKASTSKKKVTNERRAHVRIDTDSLWVVERQGDFEFRAKVANISEGGILLENRLLSENLGSQIIIKTLKHSLKLDAQGVRQDSETIGVGYTFLNMNSDSTKQLRGLIATL